MKKQNTNKMEFDEVKNIIVYNQQVSDYLIYFSFFICFWLFFGQVIIHVDFNIKLFTCMYFLFVQAGTWEKSKREGDIC